MSGCANPGPPRPPSLHLPAAPRDLSAERSGDTVEVRFTAPRESTDKLPLPSKTIRGSFCRQLDGGACVTPPGAGGTFVRLDAGGRPETIVWRDTLPPELASGPARLLGYRVELFNAEGKSAGPSEPAFTAAGSAPPVVTGLAAHGSRRGVVLTWTPAAASAGEVILRREDLAAREATHAAKPRSTAGTTTAFAPAANKATPPVVWLAADTHATANSAADRTLDADAQVGTTYTYAAARQQTVKLGKEVIEVRSAVSAPVTITEQPVYAPAAPTGLLAAAFSNATSPDVQAPFGVDLIWQPVDDAGVTGYNVYREPVDAADKATGARQKLTEVPAPQPGFHDATAKPAGRYRYAVTAVDANGNESGAATTLLEPTEVR